MTKTESAKAAAASSESTTTRIPVVALPIAEPWSAIGTAPVFNLTVGRHEFFANGVLVSNSDALRYAIQMMGGVGSPFAREPERPKIVTKPLVLTAGQGTAVSPFTNGNGNGSHA